MDSFYQVKSKIFIATSSFNINNIPKKIIKSNNIIINFNPIKKKLRTNELIKYAYDANYIVAGTEIYNDKVFNKLKNLKTIFRLGSGIDNINLQLATKHKVKILKSTITPEVAVAELTLSNIINVLRKINLQDFNLIIRNQLDFMKKKRFGRIINCSSIGIKFGGGKNSYNYSFSKHASEFVPSELRYLAKYNVFRNNLRLGLINTKIHKKLKRNKKAINYRLNLIPANRIAEPSEIANYILFFISDNNSFLTRETISISGGE